MILDLVVKKQGLKQAINWKLQYKLETMSTKISRYHPKQVFLVAVDSKAGANLPKHVRWILGRALGAASAAVGR